MQWPYCTQWRPKCKQLINTHIFMEDPSVRSTCKIPLQALGSLMCTIWRPKCNYLHETCALFIDQHALQNTQLCNACISVVGSALHTYACIWTWLVYVVWVSTHQMGVQKQPQTATHGLQSPHLGLLIPYIVSILIPTYGLTYYGCSVTPLLVHSNQKTNKQIMVAKVVSTSIYNLFVFRL